MSLAAPKKGCFVRNSGAAFGKLSRHMCHYTCHPLPSALARRPPVSG